MSQHIEVGSFVRFSTSSPPIPVVAYQWFRNGEIIPGAHSANFDLYNVGPIDRGEFRVRLKTENAATWSQEVELEVTPQVFRPGMIDTSFSVGSVIGSKINVIVPARNGDLYLGGAFDQIAGHPRGNIARVGSDGLVDLSFNASFTTPGPDTDPEVRAIAVDSENRIIVGGRFTQCNGQPRQNIARLHPNGSLDLTFNPNANGEVNTFAFDQQNRLIIGGSFTSFGNVPASRLLRLRVDGSLDSNFINQQSFDASVEDIIRDGDQFYIAGGFTERIVKLNDLGARDLSFESFRPRSAVTDLAVLPNGGLIVSGRFSGGLIKLDPTGQLDENFGPRPNDFIHDICATEDGRILVVGDFTRLAGISIRSLARLFANGDLDETFQPPSFDGPVNTLHLLDGELLVGGEFARPHNKVMRILPSPPVPPPVIPVILNHPRSREVWPGSVVTLSVGLAESFGMSYQWYGDDGQILNANSQKLQLQNFGSEQVGNYHVVVTVGGVSISSQSARVSLAPATGLAPRAQFEASPQLLSGTGTTIATISVPSSFQLARVRPHLEIDHPKMNDLTITLEAPDGTKVTLYDRNGRRGRDLRTTFDSFAPADLNDGAAPWQGTWKPDQDLSAFQNRSSLGSWTLKIKDPSGSVNGGSLELFRLELIAQDPQVNFTNWLNPNPKLEHLHLDQERLCFTHYRWRNAPGLVYEYQALQGSAWVPFIPTLLYQENLGNNQDALQWRLPNPSHSKIIRLWVRSE